EDIAKACQRVGCTRHGFCSRIEVQTWPLPEQSPKTISIGTWMPPFQEKIRIELGNRTKGNKAGMLLHPALSGLDSGRHVRVGQGARPISSRVIHRTISGKDVDSCSSLTQTAPVWTTPWGDIPQPSDECASRAVLPYTAPSRT